MPRQYRFRDVERVLLARGFRHISQVGSHVKFRKTGKQTLTVIVPKKQRSIPIGTFRSILRQAAMTVQVFEQVLNDR
ncbi:MAG: type II toxin-antitoxin system HicA family toxin [Patescibacteria group bacterium]